MAKRKKVEAFINSQHVMTFATIHNNTPYCCSVFYLYDAATHSFIFASDTKSQHIQNAFDNPLVSANIHLQTDIVGQIQGVQIQGIFTFEATKEQKCSYFKRFPYALAMKPKIWRFEAQRFKYTDNRLGFGKKIIFDFVASA